MKTEHASHRLTTTLGRPASAAPGTAPGLEASEDLFSQLLQSDLSGDASLPLDSTGQPLKRKKDLPTPPPEATPLVAWSPPLPPSTVDLQTPTDRNLNSIQVDQNGALQGLSDVVSIAALGAPTVNTTTLSTATPNVAPGSPAVVSALNPSVEPGTAAPSDLAITSSTAQINNPLSADSDPSSDMLGNPPVVSTANISTAPTAPPTTSTVARFTPSSDSAMAGSGPAALNTPLATPAERPPLSSNAATAPEVPASTSISTVERHSPPTPTQTDPVITSSAAQISNPVSAGPNPSTDMLVSQPVVSTANISTAPTPTPTSTVARFTPSSDSAMAGSGPAALNTPVATPAERPPLSSNAATAPEVPASTWISTVERHSPPPQTQTDLARPSPTLVAPLATPWPSISNERTAPSRDTVSLGLSQDSTALANTPAAWATESGASESDTRHSDQDQNPVFALPTDAGLASKPVETAANPGFAVSLGQAMNDAFESLGAQVSYWSSQNVKHAAMQLEDAQGGTMQVEVALDNGQVQLTFMTDHTPTREALQQHAQQTLSELLARSGVELAGLNIHSQNTAFNGQSNDGQRTTAQQQNSRSTPEISGQTEAPATTPMRRTDPRRALDTFA